jgi:hypothetical protein
VRIVNEAIQDCVGDGWITNVVVPVFYGELRLIFVGISFSVWLSFLVGLRIRLNSNLKGMRINYSVPKDQGRNDSAFLLSIHHINQ